MNQDRATTLASICAALSADDPEQAAVTARAEYPFAPPVRQKRTYTPLETMRVFVRDGFRDRYSGQRLVFPGTLRLLSHLLPAEFPVHPNWKMSESHLVYWELFPTLDHVVPVARGGADVESNWVTTSMLRNSAKAHWTLEELGWTLQPEGSLEEWDGLTGWFLDYTREHPDLLGDTYLKRWWSAATQVIPAA